MNIENKRIIITGASSGIGLLLLEQLLQFPGVKILAIARNLQPLAAYQEKICLLQQDISSQAGVDKIFAVAEDYMGGFDIFFANAGYSHYGNLTSPNWQEIESMFHTNVLSPIYSLEKALETNSNQPFSFIITASGAGLVPLPGHALYTSGKFALRGFVRSFAYELPSHCHLMTVYPVAMETNFFKRANNRQVPLPFPKQKPDLVVKKILQGLEKGKKSVFPSHLFKIALLLDRIFPFIMPLYGRNEKRKFKNWQKNK